MLLGYVDDYYCSTFSGSILPQVVVLQTYWCHLHILDYKVLTLGDTIKLTEQSFSAMKKYVFVEISCDFTITTLIVLA